MEHAVTEYGTGSFKGRSPATAKSSSGRLIRKIILCFALLFFFTSAGFIPGFPVTFEFHKRVKPSLKTANLPKVVAKAAKACREVCFGRKLNYDFWEEEEKLAWEKGPCVGVLSVSYKSSRKEVGCDIAHCPRLQVDLDKSNQCNLSSWVELDTSCELLRYRETIDKDRQGVACSADGAVRYDLQK